MRDWEAGEVRTLPLGELGEHYRRYRMPDAEVEAALGRSLSRYGQVSPLVACLREDRPEVIDGFKRLAAARTLAGVRTLSVRLLAADDRTAKAAIYGLNQSGRSLRELEEAWIVHALVREDGLAQQDVAELMGRHKSWVSRRLALLERLAGEAREDLRLGLLTVSAARALVQLPTGNQLEVLACARREGLSTVEMRGVVDLLRGAAGPPQMEYVLKRPRQALAQAQAGPVPAHDPRLSATGNRVARQLGQLLELLGRMENWLSHRGRADLTGCDHALLVARFSRLGDTASTVAELAGALGSWQEGEQPT
jgi:ParB-like chromosome segregation protein Spo0J